MDGMRGERERDPGLGEKLRRSEEAAEGLRPRTIRCPNCGFRLLEVRGDGHYLVSVKCRKCKFDRLIDTAWFRTQTPRGKGGEDEDGTGIYLHRP